MNRTVIVAAVGLSLAAALFSVPASAQGARSFVSAHGNDGNTCSIVSPCRTFARAYNTTNAGGEITVVDPAGYGPLTISKALSIVNDGVGEAGVILIAPGVAITINAGPSDPVSLRGLTLDGGGTASSGGILFNTGQSLTVSNCVIRHFGADGIDFSPNATSNLLVSNTMVADNASSGVSVFPNGSGVVTAMFNRVEMNNNASYGIHLTGTSSTGSIKATVSDGVAARNGAPGFAVVTAIGHAPTTLSLFHSVSVNNNDAGIAASGTGATLRLAQSEVTGNAAGWNVGSGGVLASYGDNYIDGNGGNTGSLTPVAKQ